MSTQSADLRLLSVPFPEKEIEWRVGQCGKKGNGQVWATCLAYVQARAIMTRLDDVVGPGGWRVSYRTVPGGEKVEPGVICELAIKVDGEWVTKEDGAEQTDIESFKGGISSALKRAGSAWGVGRYLYGLDTGFAQTVERGTQDALYGKTKDGTEFYWLPPKLPQWALPEGHAAGKQTGTVKPGMPSHEDGDSEQIEPWKFSFGQWNTKTLEQVYNDPKFGPKKMAEWCDFIIASSKKKGEEPGARAAEAIQQIENFLGAMENGGGK